MIFLMTRLSASDQKVAGVFSGWSWPVRIVVGAMLLVLGMLLGNYAIYGEWPWTAYPANLRMCGLDFEKQGSPQTRQQLEAVHHEKLVRIGDMPGWLNRGDLWAYADEQPYSGSCRVVMMVRDGDHFQTYVGP